MRLPSWNVQWCRGVDGRAGFRLGVDIPDTHSRAGRSRFGNQMLPRLTALRIDANTQASDHQQLIVELEP